MASQKRKRSGNSILRAVFAVLLAVLCIGAFWFAAVLMQPPVLEEPAGIVESMNEQ